MASGSRDWGKPPPNYVAGVGRGAMGFTTRSDIGPARLVADKPEGESGASAEGSNAASGGDDNAGPDEFDEFEGNDKGLFASGEYDEDDKAADNVWAAVDARMDTRRKDRREARLKEMIEQYRADNPKITEQFAPFKRKLEHLSVEDWESIPEIGDYTIKRNKVEKFSRVSDSLLQKAQEEALAASAPTDQALQGALDGIATPAALSGTQTDLTAVGEGRETVLKLNLQRMSDSVSGQTVVDPKGYLTDLSAMKISSAAEISDIKKARLLLRSVTSTNPKHAPGWIAAARLEEHAGKISQARQLIARACEECIKSEDVWEEAARLAPPDEAKGVLARGVRAIPNSVKLWLAAAKLEVEEDKKKRVLRKALEVVPTSVRLWKEAVALESPEDARVILARAVECCPQHTELWLALARLEEYGNAKKILNRARQAIPTDALIWITAAKLEEANGGERMEEKVNQIVRKALKSLQSHGVVIQRESWLKEAEAAEKASSVVTCHAIVSATIGYGVDAQDQKRTWMADAEDCIKRRSTETARAIYKHSLSVFPGKKGVWLRAAILEKQLGNKEGVSELLQRAVDYCPNAEELWLMAAKEAWLGENVESARNILQDAFGANPSSESIWLAAFKLEFQTKELVRASAILEKARQRIPSQRVFMKAAITERQKNDPEAERNLLQEGLKKFPKAEKMWAMLAQLEERLKDHGAARLTYEEGLKHCSKSLMLWLGASRLEERQGLVARGRALLDQARLKLPGSDTLWLAKVRLEMRANQPKAAEAALAKGLQECPKSGLLWAETIKTAPRPQRRAKSVDALKNCDSDPLVISAVAQLFAADRKSEKARSWFERASTLGAEVGDVWAAWYRFEVQLGKEDMQKKVQERAQAAEPRYGEVWPRVVKSPENTYEPFPALLKKVASKLEDPEYQI